MSTSYTGEQINFLKYSHSIGIFAMEGRGFYYPADAAIGKDGRIYVVNRGLEGDPLGVRVTVCNLQSEFWGTFGGSEIDQDLFKWPTCIALDSQGQVYIGDGYTNGVTVFDPSGTVLDAWGAAGPGPGELDGPSGMAFDGEDNIYIVDHQHNRIQKFTKDGRFLSAFGSAGDGDGQFNLPWGVAVDARGEIYVADWRNDRIQRFSADGEFIAKYGTPGRGDGQLNRPASVAVDGEGYVYVADWGNERVQVLDPDGRFVMKLRGESTDSPWSAEFLENNTEEAGARSRSDMEPEIMELRDDPFERSSGIEKYFWAPVSVKLDEEGRLYVTESNRHRMQIYERGS